MSRGTTHPALFRLATPPAIPAGCLLLWGLVSPAGRAQPAHVGCLLLWGLGSPAGIPGCVQPAHVGRLLLWCLGSPGHPPKAQWPADEEWQLPLHWALMQRVTCQAQ